MKPRPLKNDSRCQIFNPRVDKQLVIHSRKKGPVPQPLPPLSLALFSQGLGSPGAIWAASQPENALENLESSGKVKSGLLRRYGTEPRPLLTATLPQTPVSCPPSLQLLSTPPEPCRTSPCDLSQSSPCHKTPRQHSRRVTLGRGERQPASQEREAV